MIGPAFLSILLNKEDHNCFSRRKKKERKKSEEQKQIITQTLASKQASKHANHN